MKKLLVQVAISGLMLASVATFASEPRNLADIKNDLKRYHDSGAYEQDIAVVVNQATDFLKAQLKNSNNKKPAIVLDIDETSLTNYADMIKLDFGGSYQDIRMYEDMGSDDAIKPTLKLYQFAKAHNVAVFFLTGRFENERAATAENLKKVGFNNWDGLILRYGDYKKAPAAVYKTAMRKHLTEEGYNIILTMGDQESDIRGGYAAKGFKLPNPYYYIP